MWRIVAKGWATLDEIQERWSLVELLEANLVLSAIEVAEAEARKR